jgi:hypothetical protein
MSLGRITATPVEFASKNMEKIVVFGVQDGDGFISFFNHNLIATAHIGNF